MVVTLLNFSARGPTDTTVFLMSLLLLVTKTKNAKKILFIARSLFGKDLSIVVSELFLVMLFKKLNNLSI